MAIQQPSSTSKLNSPDHALSHRVIAIDEAAPVKKIIVEEDGTVKIGDSVGGNSTIIKPDGEVNLEGTARVTRGISINNANLGKGSTAPSQVIIGNYNSWEFSINDDSVFTFHLPNNWAVGTDVILEICWYIDEAGGDEIKWRVDWSATPHNSTEVIDAPTDSGNSDTGDIVIPATVKYLTTNDLIIPGANLSVEDQLGIKLSRISITDGVNPTNKPAVIDIHIQYTLDKLGEAT